MATREKSLGPSGRSGDSTIAEIEADLRSIQNCEERIGNALRLAFDQIYNGRFTGRFRPDQLAKVEKTHIGSLVEINLQRELGLLDGENLDFSIAGHDVDCKYSQRIGGWMIPPEAVDKICLLVHASDETAMWRMGLVRCSEDRLRHGGNRDSKRGLGPSGREAIRWIWIDAPFPENVLITLPDEDIDAIMGQRSGQSRLDELFRRVQGRRIPRGTVATVAQQDDFMKRARSNGGSRTRLREEGIVIFGDSLDHRALAVALGLPEPARGSFVAARLVPAGNGVRIDGASWRVAASGERTRTAAPRLPEKRHARQFLTPPG